MALHLLDILALGLDGVDSVESYFQQIIQDGPFPFPGVTVRITV